MTIRRRLSLSAAVAVAVAVALASVASYVAVRAKLREEVDDSLRERVTAIQEFAREGPPGGPPGGRDGGPPREGDGGPPGVRDGSPPGGDGAGPPDGRPGKRSGDRAPSSGDDAQGGPDDGRPVLPDQRRPGAGFGPPDGRPPPPRSSRFGGASGYVQLVDTRGAVRRFPGESGTTIPVDERARSVARGESGEFLADRDVDGDHLRVMTAPLGSGTAIQAARPLGEVDSVLRGLTAVLAAITLAGVALAALLGGLVSRSALMPVRRFTERTETIADRADLASRLPEGRDDELGRLAHTFNSTLDDLESSVTAQRQLVADASHELRTPLASLRTNIEILQQNRELPEADRRELMADVKEEIDDLTRLVADVVELARRGESHAHHDDVPLHEIVAGAVERARRHAPEVVFDVELEPAVVHGAAERLDRAVYNLLENAAKWSGEGGRVEVRLQSGELTVRDHGPGFEPDDLPHVFDRFYRARAARKMRGSGLGLAIVRQVTELHGGTVRAENAPGGGAVLRLRLPASGGAGGAAGAEGAADGGRPALGREQREPE